MADARSIQSLQTTSPDETEAWARTLARTLEAGDILALEGELGAGKTTLVRGLAAGLGIDPGLVSSPTFALMNEYEGPKLTLVHIDAYRLSGPAELAGLGWEQLIEDPRIVLAVEWPSKIQGSLPPHRTITIALEHVDERTRALTITPKRGWTTCPTTGKRVPPQSPTWPFADEKARMADLYGWFAGKHAISRPIDPEIDDPAGLPHAPSDEHDEDA